MIPHSCQHLAILNDMVTSGQCTSLLVTTTEGQAWVHHTAVSHVEESVWAYGEALLIDESRVVMTAFDLKTGDLTIALDDGSVVGLTIIRDDTAAVILL